MYIFYSDHIENFTVKSDLTAQRRKADFENLDKDFKITADSLNQLQTKYNNNSAELEKRTKQHESAKSNTSIHKAVAQEYKDIKKQQDSMIEKIKKVSTRVQILKDSMVSIGKLDNVSNDGINNIKTGSETARSFISLVAFLLKILFFLVITGLLKTGRFLYLIKSERDMYFRRIINYKSFIDTEKLQESNYGNWWQ